MQMCCGLFPIVALIEQSIGQRIGSFQVAKSDVFEFCRKESDGNVDEDSLPTAAIPIAWPSSSDGMVVVVDDMLQAVA